MKKCFKLISMTFIFALFLLTICGSNSVASVSLSTHTSDMVQFNYKSITQNQNELTLYVDYKSGSPFEIIKDIEVSSDQTFKASLPLINSTIEGNSIKYTFYCDDNFDNVYIKAPEVYMPVKIDRTEIALNSVSTLDATINESWLEISDISWNEESENSYKVTITYQSQSDYLPRVPKLNINGTELGGLSIMTFDDGILDKGTLIYNVSLKSGESIDTLLKESTLVVENAIERTHIRSGLAESSVNVVNIAD